MKLENKKILIISPHPDDEIIGCGGLIAYCKKKKIKINVLYVTVGASRQLITGKTDYKTRFKEIQNVSNYGKFSYKILFKDKYFVELDNVAQKIIIDPIEDYIEKIKPEFVFLPFGNSYNQDHRATYLASITALRPAPNTLKHYVKNVLIYEEPYSWCTGKNFEPNSYLDTKNFEKEKIKLMKLHRTQDRKFPFARSKENLLARMKIRGSECGLESAEAFRLIRGTLS